MSISKAGSTMPVLPSIFNHHEFFCFTNPQSFSIKDKAGPAVMWDRSFHLTDLHRIGSTGNAFDPVEPLGSFLGQCFQRP